MLKRIVFMVKMAVGVALVALVVQGQASGIIDATQPPPQEVVTKQSRSDRLFEKHDCWNGEAPKDVGPFGPGHAVVTLPGHKAQYVSADVGYGIWLEGKPGTLHGFCR